MTFGQIKKGDILKIGNAYRYVLEITPSKVTLFTGNDPPFDKVVIEGNHICWYEKTDLRISKEVIRVFNKLL